MSPFRYLYAGAAVCAMIALFVLLPLDAPRQAEEAPGPDPRPSQWAWEQRVFPHGTADREAYRESVAEAQRMRAAAPTNVLAPVTFAGPTNIGGRITDLEFDPHDMAGVYAGAATGGVFRSADSGRTWIPIFDDQANLTIGDIGMDPINPGVLYVGTGEANGGHNNFAGGGVYKSSDGGDTWQFLGLENTVSIGRILVDPTDAQRVFVAAAGSYFAPNPERGVYRSTDGGASWDLSLFVTDSTGAIDLIMDPANPQRMMAAMWERVRYPNGGTHLYGPTGGIFRSTDGGDNWTRLPSSTGLPDPIGNRIGRIGLAISQSSPDIVMALYTDGSNYTGLYRSTNFGDSWTQVDPSGRIADGTGGFSWYFGQVRIHPANPNIVYALDVAYMRSTDAGQTFPILYGYQGSPADFHVDHHALAFHPGDPNYIVEGNDGGINISTDGGVTFSKVAELPVNQFYEIGLDASNPERLFGGTQDNGTLRTRTGALNDWDRIWGGDGFYVIVDPTNPNIIYAESQFGNLVKSVNGGNSFNGATNGISGSEPTNWSTPVVMDPANSSVLYYGTNRLYRTINGAASWVPVSPDLTDGPQPRLGTITTIGVSPVDNDVIWVGTDDANVWVSADYGSSWSNVSAGLPYRWVTRVVPDPVDPQVAYVTFSGLKWVDPQPHVFRTTDAGQNWSDISANLPDAPVNGFAVDPLRPNLLFVGSDLGAYYSVDTGASWQYLSTDLPMIPVYDLKVHPTANYLALGTHGRSMYTLDLATITGVESPVATALPVSPELAQNYPNPFNGTTRIGFRLDRPAPVRLVIYDALGRAVRTLVDGTRAAGRHAVSWDGRTANGTMAASGVYLYRLEAGEMNLTRKMMFVQ